MKERQGPTRPVAPERKAPTTVNRARPRASSAQRDAGAVDRRHRGRPIGGGGRVDFAGINRAALATLPSLLERILHGGKIVGAEYVVLNPRRADRHPSSFKINVATGQWADFATGDKGRDPVSLIAYLNDIPQAGASRELARLLRPTEGDGVVADRFDLPRRRDGQTGPATRRQPADRKQEAAAPTLPPADAEPAVRAAARLYGRRPDAGWRYLTAQGERAFFVCRWDTGDGGKDIRPLCWFADDGWRFGHWPHDRPLYRLDEIAAEPEARVIVCEGEKAADAAARVFPKSIATTSSGGAHAASKSDWAPLAGRRALIWPDNDAPGAKYAHDVAATLAALDCDVFIVDASAMAALDPDGGAREAAEGYDAADALAEWANRAALRRAAVRLAKRFDPGPAFVSFAPYTMADGGLSIEVVRGRGEAKEETSIRIASAFEVLGACRDPHGAGWGKVLRWRDADGRGHVRHVADAALQGEPGVLCAGLADQGLQIDRCHQRDLVGYLCSVQTRRRVTLVSRTGWHELAGRFVFVLPGETIGPRGGERVILDGTASGAYERRGNLKDWRAGAVKLAKGHALPVLAISASFAGTLLVLAGIEGGGLHFFGPSSIGKSTLLALAASVWSRGDAQGFVRSWRATANGLEGAAAGANDTALILDDVGQVDAREMGAALYMLANGAGKARAARDGSLREPRSWRLLTISTGEVPVDAKLAEDRGRKPRAGQLVRMLDIPTSRAFGVFDSAGPDDDAAALADECKLAAKTAYGTAGPEFVRRRISDRVTGDEVRAMVDDFLKAHAPRDADGQVVRAAQRLGLIAAAGELATRFGLTGCDEGEASEAAAWALGEWVKARGGTDPAEVRQAVEQVRLFIEAHGAARFDDIDDRERRPAPNRAGWRRSAGDDQRWLIPPEIWKAEVCAGLDAKFVARVLAERGMLEKGGDGNAKVERIEGRTQRVYIVTPRIFAGAGRDGEPARAPSPSRARVPVDADL